MKATQRLHEIGQSIWLDNLTRGLLASGKLREYIEDLTVTGLTSNPTIFDHAIRYSQDYDDAIRQKLKEGNSGEELFFELAIGDLRHAADHFRPIYDRTNGADAWASLEVSPWLSRHTAGTLVAAKALHGRANRPNLFVKIPGASAGFLAIEEAIFAGVPVNMPPPVLRRKIYPGCLGIPARHRASYLRRTESICRLSGFAVRQPLGCNGC